MKCIKLAVRILLLGFYLPAAMAIVPMPAADQSEPIAVIGAIIHTGDGVITFDEGVITAVGSAQDGISLAGHRVIDLQGQHVYPGFVLPVSSLGLLEIDNIRATNDVTEEGDINASVRAAIAYNTDSEFIPTQRFNGVLTAQVTPRGGLVSGYSSVMKLDGWNWEDAVLKVDDAMHLHWPDLSRRRYNEETERMELSDNEDYDAQVRLLHELFQNASTYTGSPINLNLQAMQPLLAGSVKLFIHADQAKEIISAVRFARAYGIANVVLVGGEDALSVVDFLVEESVPVVYQAIHALPGMEWQDVDLPFKTPGLLHEAGVKVGIGGGQGDIHSDRNLPFYAGTAAAYGLDREVALTMVTRNNAEILGVADRVGTLEPGKDATLFISIGDALDMRTSQVQQAFIQGREIDLYGTQQELYERYFEKYSSPRLD